MSDAKDIANSTEISEKTRLSNKRRKRIGNLCFWGALILSYLFIEGHIVPIKQDIELKGVVIAIVVVVCMIIKFLIQKLIK